MKEKRYLKDREAIVRADIWKEITSSCKVLRTELGYKNIQIIEFLKEREQFGRAIADFQAVQFQLADLACKIEAVRSLTYRAAAAIDLGSRYIELGAMCKKMAGEMVVEVTSACHELLGGRGYLVPHSLERRMRDARLALVADGTTNIQRLVIARSLVGRR